MDSGSRGGGGRGCTSTRSTYAAPSSSYMGLTLTPFILPQMVAQYEVSLRLQRTHAGNVVESTLRRRSAASKHRVYSARVLPDERAVVSPSLIPAMRKLKWQIQRDRLAQLVKARSEMVRNGGVVAWLEDRGKAVMRRENERVRLALCPGIGGIVRFYEDLSHR